MSRRLRAWLSPRWEFALSATLFVISVNAAVYHLVQGALGVAGYFLLCALGLLWACSAFAESAALQALMSGKQRAEDLES